MKIYALEEHFLTPAVRGAWSQLEPEYQDPTPKLFDSSELEARLDDFAKLRLSQMDESGVDVQVLSLTSPAVQSLDREKSVELAAQTNDFVCEIVRRKPERFDGFAALPTPDPQKAASELERAHTKPGFKGAMLYGRTRERNLDHPDFIPIFEAAANLRAPLYFHPQIPQPAVREAYYSGFDEKLDGAFASSGWGWHLETDIQAVRLILSGIFDRLPDLQIILGHWGESMLFYLDRINDLSEFAKSLKKPVADYAHSNFYITPSGIFNPKYLKWTLEVRGAERVMFSTDYPYKIAPGQNAARDFIEKSGLDDETQRLIANGNWQRLTGQIKSNESGK